MSRFTEFKEPELVKGDEYKAIDHVGATLAVKVKGYKERIVTPNSPEGGPGVIVDLVDLETSKVYRDTLWMSGAIVDRLKPYVGGLLVIKFERQTSKASGRPYPCPVPVDSAGTARAEKWFADNGDPFAPKFGTVADNDKPPF
jgi:hypothetical protein